MLRNGSGKPPGLIDNALRDPGDGKLPGSVTLEPFRAGWRLRGLFLLLLVWVGYRGLVPSFQVAAGDFANYHTSAQILLSNQSLERAYWDFSWFQKQIDLSGVQSQMGGFIPHPPPTALLLIPLAGFDPVTAKSIWTAVNLLLAIGSALLLTRISGLPLLLTGILLLSTGGALINNLLFGQVYLFVLFSILLGSYFEQKQRPFLSGICFGSLAGVKLLGVAWLLYYAWKGRNRVVLGGVVALGVVTLAVAWLDGFQIFITFFTEVFPRLLASEIQDPFSTRWQSWNSLFRRLFLYEQTLNPTPAFDSPLLFFAAKNLVFWLLSGLSIVVIVTGRDSSKEHNELLRLGWIPLCLLLLSPGGATYHVLLLTISAVFFTRILLDSRRPREAIILWLLLLCINLSHHLWLEPLVGGWSTILVYSRLGFLLLYFILCLTLLADVQWRSVKIRWILLTMAIASVSGIWQFHQYQNRVDDAAVWLMPRGTEFDRHLGLLLDSPNSGSAQMVFSYGELFRDRYSVYSTDGIRWTPPSNGNFYDPDLYQDDRSLLIGTVTSQRQEVLLSPSRGSKPEFVAVGSNPSWAPDGRSFAFLNRSRAYLCTLPDRAIEPLPVGGNLFDIEYSPGGDELVYCSRDSTGFRLARFSLTARREEALLHSRERIQGPSWSPDGSHVLFSWTKNSNADIWALNPGSGELTRLTRHPGNDENPVWDSKSNRIVFVSDRGRGLQFGTLYSLPIPHSLEK